MVLVALELPAKHRRSLHPGSVLSRDPLPDWIYLISISIAFFHFSDKISNKKQFQEGGVYSALFKGMHSIMAGKTREKEKGDGCHTTSTARKQGANRKCD